MGRGGPVEPEVAEWPPSPAELLALSRAGRHAASDYLEDAALAGVVTIGCRRAGGGLAGATAFSNVHAGAEEALARSPDLVIFEGSGSALPPVQTSRRVLVAPAGSDVTGYLNAYRLLISDLLVLTMAEDARRHGRDPRAPPGPPDRPGRAPAAAGRADRRPERRVLLDRARSGASGARGAPARRARRGRGHGLRQPRPARGADGATWSGPRPRSGSSSSRRPRSTSSPRRRSRAESRSSSSTTRCCSPELDAELAPGQAARRRPYETRVPGAPLAVPGRRGRARPVPTEPSRRTRAAR